MARHKKWCSSEFGAGCNCYEKDYGKEESIRVLTGQSKPFGNYGDNCAICKGKCIGHGDF